MRSIWLIWAINLLAQNFMFTIVSRARNSGSLRRHVLAAIGSNGVWILQLQIMLGPMMEYLNGKHGVAMQVAAAGFYTTFTVTGSVLAHYWALKTEKGKGAVGASKKYVQITPEEWDRVQKQLAKLSGTAPDEPKVSSEGPKMGPGMSRNPCLMASAKAGVLEEAAASVRMALSRLDEQELLRLTRYEAYGDGHGRQRAASNSF